ncbi:hypothetical protein AB0M45_32765 [Nocardia sp. NPDC051787]|uniref:hypothetical protein n=1 Tax=Nocardia sp. NPDC051787 TaxID=3155415 RepID=UPI003443CD9A
MIVGFEKMNPLSHSCLRASLTSGPLGPAFAMVLPAPETSIAPSAATIAPSREMLYRNLSPIK